MLSKYGKIYGNSLCRWGVLILVLMEYALEDCQFKTQAHLLTVLILVLMEYALEA